MYFDKNVLQNYNYMIIKNKINNENISVNLSELLKRNCFETVKLTEE